MSDWTWWAKRLVWLFGAITLLFFAVGAPVLTWTVAALVGLSFAFRGVLIAYGNLVAVQTLKRNGPNELVARQGLRNESLRMAKQAIALALALLVILDRDFGPFVVGGLVIIQTITTIATVLDRRDDRRLLELVGVLEEGGSP